MLLEFMLCEKCHTPLDMNEIRFCKACEEKIKLEEKYKLQRKQAKRDEVIDFFLNLTEYEKEGLKEIIQEKGKEIKQRKIKEQINKLNKELVE